MTIEQKSVLNLVEVLMENPGVGVRIALKIIKDGSEISSKWHRTFIPLDFPPALQMAAVNEHLASMGEAPVSDADIAKVVAMHTACVALASPE